MGTNLSVLIIRIPLVPMAQNALLVLIMKNPSAQMEESGLVLMVQHQKGLDVLMDPAPPDALMEKLQLVPMELLRFHVLMERNSGVLKEPLLAVTMELLLDEKKTILIIIIRTIIEKQL